MKTPIDLWNKNEYLQMRPGLKRIKAYLSAKKNPQNAYPVVQIAGTNGKGSVAKIIAECLAASGYKAGLYTSPHMVEVTERISICGKRIPLNKFNAITSNSYAAAKKHSLTYFEFITAAAFEYFSKNKVEIAVLETGLGGRFDATNVTDKPLCSVITDVDFDHKEVLGNSLKRIAYEKAGIIKKGCPVVSGALKSEAQAEIRRIARIKNAELYELNKDFKYQLISTDWGNKSIVVDYSGIRDRSEVRLSLLGRHQGKNLAVALAVLEVLNSNGFNVDFARAAKALKKICWPGRFDVRKNKGNTLIFDGAHNPSAMNTFRKTFEESPWGKAKRTFVFALMKDKAGPEIIRILAPLVKKVLVLKLDNERELSAESQLKYWARFLSPKKIIVLNNEKEVFERIKNDKAAVFTGSIYLVGKIFKYLNIGEN